MNKEDIGIRYAKDGDIETYDKFTYTADDATGCILQRPNYEQCKYCVYNYDDEPFHCLIFKDYKPSAIIHNGEKCKDKRTE